MGTAGRVTLSVSPLVMFASAGHAAWTTLATGIIGRTIVGLTSVLGICTLLVCPALRGEAAPAPRPRGAPVALPAAPRLAIKTPSLDLGVIGPGVELVSAPLAGTVAFPTGAGRIGLLLPPGRERMLLVDRKGRAAILLTWELRYQGLNGWTPWLPATVGVIPDAGPALFWHVVVSAPQASAFQVRCRLEAAPMQLAGKYVLERPLQCVATDR